jgi:hypothetical protein
MSTLNFKNAASDFRFLKNRQYPEKAALKLIGDRYRLSAVERNCLLRGIVVTEQVRARRIKRTEGQAVQGRDLGIDWFNVLITLESYLKGAVLFLADDSLLRDSAAVHGSYRPGVHTDRAIGLVVEALVRLHPRRADIFIDSPIAHSKQLCADLAERLHVRTVPFAFAASLEASADFKLKSYPGIVATSDSVIIDACRAFIDLPRLILSNAFSYRPVRVSRLDLERL